MVREAFVMKKLFLGLALSALISLPVLAALKVGDKAPDFSARASLAGKEFNFSLENALKKGPVVVYFYPSAYTKGCDLEAHTFAEKKDKFDAAGATIIEFVFLLRKCVRFEIAAFGIGRRIEIDHDRSFFKRVF